jgi:hypothetical protein
MRIRQFAAAALIGLAALGLSACATGLNTQVSRYQSMPAPSGQTFYVVPASGTGSLQFNRYATMVAQQLQARGYQPAGAPQLADMLVRVDYGVDESVRDENPGYGGFGPGYGGFGAGYGGFGPYGFRSRYYDPFYSPFYGRPYYSAWGNDPFYYGWDDPFSYYGGGYGGYGYGPFGYGGREYTEYRSHLDMDIVQRGNNAPLFEGHAKARSQTDNTDVLVPDLITAMFTGFPGRSGETVRISVPPPQVRR